MSSSNGGVSQKREAPSWGVILFAVAVVVAILGFVSHAYVDLFQLTWDAWDDLVH